MPGMRGSGVKFRVSVIGGVADRGKILELADRLGEAVGQRGWVLVTGGLSGAMEAACRGARRAGGLTVGILPGTNPKEANPYVDLVLTTGMGHARNALVVLNSDVVVAIGGSWGTLSEMALAKVYGKPVLGLHAPDVGGVEHAEGLEEVVAWLEARAKELGFKEPGKKQPEEGKGGSGQEAPKGR
jgi:uncharacterized protein (TIGR00725 family)